MDTKQAQSIYASLLSILPPRYQDEFGEEMQAVFAQTLTDAVDGGDRAIWSLIFKEIRDLPRLAIQEHWRERNLPPYQSLNTSDHARPPTPAWAIWISLSIFLIPAILAALDGILSPQATTVLLIPLLIAIFVIGLFGIRRGIIPWALPWIGMVSGWAGIILMQFLMSGFFGRFLYSLAQDLTDRESLLPRLAWQFFTAGIFWICMSAVVIIILAALRFIPKFSSIYAHFRDDWTLVSFMFFGCMLPLILASLDDYRYEERLQAAIFTVLALGAWGFLRSHRKLGRIFSLLTAASMALLLMGIGMFILVPQQDWPTWFAQHPPQNERWFEALSVAVTWFWTIVALLSSWLARRRPPMLFANMALCSLLLILFRPIYPYLEIIFSRQEFRLNQIALAGVIGLLIYQARRKSLNINFSSQPAFHLPALAMLLGSSGMFILVERVVDINTLSASLFGLAVYGLVGLWLEPFRWRQGLPAALLLIGTLPFSEHLQTFVGYPVRLLTAVIVRDGLAAFGVHSVGIDTILVFENGISQIDLPCSGVKSLWTGGMFLLAATWIERRRFNRRWFLVGLVFALMLLIANLARVAILIIVGQVLEWRLLAEMLHVPLGVLGFGGACLALVWMLRRFVTAQDELVAKRLTGTAEATSRPRWLSPALFLSILTLALIYTPRPDVAAAQARTPFLFPENLSTEPWPFSPGEMAWLSADGPLAASRWRFEYGNYHGSLLLITSDTWRAHHRPERCFETYGMTVNQSRSQLLSNDFPIRLVSLSAGKQRYSATAVYWLQSPDRVTDDYATRIWADLSPERKTWVLVTILFDHSVDPLDSDLQDLYVGLKQSVDQSFEIGDSE